MQNNLKPAMLVIAVLSLLLGLSIGQNHRQYLHIQHLTAASYDDFVPAILPFQQRKHGEQAHWPCHQAAYEALQAAKHELYAEREAMLRELHREIAQAQKEWRHR